MTDYTFLFTFKFNSWWAFFCVWSSLFKSLLSAFTPPYRGRLRTLAQSRLQRACWMFALTHTTACSLPSVHSMVFNNTNIMCTLICFLNIDYVSTSLPTYLIIFGRRRNLKIIKHFEKEEQNELINFLFTFMLDIFKIFMSGIYE